MSYSVNEAAKLVGKNPRKIKLDIRQGKLEASRLGDKPNSAYRIEYKDLRKTYSTSFETQPSGDADPMGAVKADDGQGAPDGTAQTAIPAAEGIGGEDVIIEDEPQLLRAALAREVRNNRIIQKQLTDAVKLIERLLSGQVARGKPSMPPLTLEAHMRPSNLPQDTVPGPASASPVDPAAKPEHAKKPKKAVPLSTAETKAEEEAAPDSGAATPAPAVDHVPVLSSGVAEDEKAETPKAAKKRKKAPKPPVIEASAQSKEDGEAAAQAEDDDDEIPVNELIKNYQARLDASLDMIRNLRAN